MNKQTINKLMNLFRIWIFSLSLCFSFDSFSQISYTFDQCIEFAVNNKNLIISPNATIEKSKVNYKYDLFSILPSISGSSSYNINNGRKLDMFTNTFGSNTVYSSSFYVSSQLYVFQGFRYIKQNQLNRKLMANAQVALEESKERIKQQVLDRFVGIWKIDLKIKQQESIISDLKKLLSIQKDLILAGKISGLDTLQTSVNYKTQQISLLNLNKERNFETLQLNYLLGKSLSDKILINTTTIPKGQIRLEEDFQLKSIENQLVIVRSQYGVTISQMYPNISISGFKNTGFSTNNKDYTLPEQPVYSFESQIQNNQYQGIGLNLNVPIFNKGEFFKQRKLYEIAKLEQENLFENKKIEKERKIIEIQQNKNALNEIALLNKSILKDKQKIYEMNLSLYEAGKIRLNDLEKAQNDYVNFQNSIEELKVELFKLNVILIE